ncbi:indole-3-acetaldehyde oxidase-like [Anoplophora glabripennis]|uniref:indole-3-acetaldehyde oxidase-like n=1 Tax=Anoplophora glabripennis TaxID=217634 RepID=UPI000874FF3B|nr:indole-3-acetaldehyde oxidase-like [Anoplophora glabripennis]
MDLLQEIIIFVNGRKCAVNASEVSPQTNLNTFLRDYLHLTGTKRMCLEGGCGACIVSVDRINPVTGKLETFCINSCLVSVFSCFGWDVFTVEGIGNSSSKHKIQDVLKRHNGTQCGYCTPGMVMNMFALQKSTEDVTMKQVENSFGGNICRCTGYRPILSAFKTLCKDASDDLFERYPDIEDANVCTNVCTKKCCFKINSAFYFKLDKQSWIKVIEFGELIQVMKSFHGSKTSYMLVAGNTGKGVYRTEKEFDVYVDILDVQDLLNHEINNKLIIGANISLTNAMNLFDKLSKENSKFRYLSKLSHHIDLIANVPVRNTGTLAGNLMLKHQYNNFPSDVFLFLETIGAHLQVVDINNKVYDTTLQEFLLINMSDKVLKKIVLPALNDHYYYESYKIMPRAQNAHALVNAGFLLKINDKLIVEDARIVYGCINKTYTHAVNTEKYLVSKSIFNNNILQAAFQVLNDELKPDYAPADPQPTFRKKLAISLFYKYILSIAPSKFVSERHRSGGEELIRPVSSGSQDFGTDKTVYPLSQSMPKIEAVAQTTGEAEYITDMPDLPNQTHAAFVLAKASPNSVIVDIITDKALEMEGVIAFLDKNDIPGKNTFTPSESGLPMEEELFCTGIVKYHSQPVGIIVAKSQEIAEKAANLVDVRYKDGNEKPVITLGDILKRNLSTKINQDKIINPKRTGTNIKHVIKGSFALSWQYHFHMETQCCSVVPVEDGLDMYPGTQWMDLAQVAASVALNIPSNRINVKVKRLGGAFGAKIVRNSLVSTAAAVAAYKLKKPVKIWMPLETNMSVIGKRYPLTSDYEVATDENGVIQYLHNTFYYDHGCGSNEPVMYLLYDTYFGLYNTETWYTNANIVNTDMHASCYTRAPGSAEGFGMIEAIMEHTALEIDMDPLQFRLTNMTKNHEKLLKHIEELKRWADIDKRKSDITEFNMSNRWRKKGLAVVPMVFPFILFPFTYGVIVSVYHCDGSVSISHGGIEIGQGINTKVIQVCAYKLGVPVNKISVKPSNNLNAPNSSPTGGSLTSEAVCWGVIQACDILLERMKPIRDKMNDPTWEELVKECYKELINLSTSSMYSPKDPAINAYEIYGVCSTEIELDVLTGQHHVSRVDLLEDVGDSISPEIDIGQVEGAFVMGLGYYTTEHVIVGENGEILTNRTWTYKPPGAKDIPIDFRVKFPNDNPNPLGILKTKATGEPPLCLAVSIPLAIRQAIASVRNEFDSTKPKWYPFDGPSTVEYNFMNCLHDYKQYTL